MSKTKEEQCSYCRYVACPCFEQGKLAGKKELVKHLCRIWWTEFNQNWDYTECCEWLKSQLKEAKK